MTLREYVPQFGQTFRDYPAWVEMVRWIEELETVAQVALKTSKDHYLRSMAREALSRGNIEI